MPLLPGQFLIFRRTKTTTCGAAKTKWWSTSGSTGFFGHHWADLSMIHTAICKYTREVINFHGWFSSMLCWITTVYDHLHKGLGAPTKNMLCYEMLCYVVYCCDMLCLVVYVHPSICCKSYPPVIKHRIGKFTIRTGIQIAKVGYWRIDTISYSLVTKTSNCLWS